MTSMWKCKYVHGVGKFYKLRQNANLPSNCGNRFTIATAKLFCAENFSRQKQKKTLKQRKPNQLGAHLILQHNAYCIMNAEENLKEKHTHNQLYICINVHILV